MGQIRPSPSLDDPPIVTSRAAYPDHGEGAGSGLREGMSSVLPFTGTAPHRE